MDEVKQNTHDHQHPSNFEEKEHEKDHTKVQLELDKCGMLMAQNYKSGSTSISKSSIVSRSNKTDNDYSNNDKHDSEKEQQNNHRRLFKSSRLTVIENGSIVAQPFPLLLHEALCKSDPDTTRIRWTHNGAAFKIIQDDDQNKIKDNNILKEKLEKTLARFSLPNKELEFKRMLWEFGWRKAVRGKYKDSFFHPTFDRYADLVDIANIQRNYQNRTNRTTEIGTAKVKASSDISASISGSSSSILSCSRKRKIESIPAIVSFVTPSPPKRRDMNICQNINPKILVSPIAMELAPSRRSRIPVSPIERFFEEIYDNQRETITATTKPSRTVSTAPKKKSDVEANHKEHNKNNSDDNEEDEDDVSDISVPMTPLSINMHEEFDLLVARI